MGDLSTILPSVPETVRRIYDHHKRQGDAEPKRGYLGASIIGHHCTRYLWYTFRGCVSKAWDGRMYRLFETGDLAEARFVAELRAIGCTVHDKDEHGRQFAVYAFGGHLSGHMDAAVLGLPEAPKTWHVGEFKTHNDDSFSKLKKDGVEKSKPQHYAQMLIYMGLTGMTRAAYLAVNKDSEELYFERVEFDRTRFDVLMARAERIIKANNPPERCADRADSYLCKFCEAHALCWGLTDQSAVPIQCRTCRTCCHATPEIDEGETWARWSCARTKCDLTPMEQDAACDSHLLLPSLVSFAEPVDAGNDWIEFRNNRDGAHWFHGNGSNARWTTLALMKTPGPAIGNKDIEDALAMFDGTCELLPLADQYNPSDSILLWTGKSNYVGDALEGLGLGDLCERVPSRYEDREGKSYTEFKNVGDGRDVLVIVDSKAKTAQIVEGKR